jgi:hypothetical protein
VSRTSRSWRRGKCDVTPGDQEPRAGKLLPCKTDLSGPTGVAALFNTLRRNWQHKCQRAYDAKVPNDTLEALRTMPPQTAVIIWIFIIFALIVPALAGVRLLPSPW